MAHALSRPRLGPRQGARHALQHRRRHPHGARHRRVSRTATGRAATRCSGTATRRSSATSRSATASRSTRYPFGHPDQRAPASASSTRAPTSATTPTPSTAAWCWSSPASSPGRCSTRKVQHLLRDEYRIRQVTKVTANTIEEFAQKLEGVERGRVPRRRSRSTTPRCSTDVPFNPNIKDGRVHERPRDQQVATGRTRSIRRRSRPMRSPAASPSPSAACASTPTAQVLNTDISRSPASTPPASWSAASSISTIRAATGLMSGAVFGRIAGAAAAGADGGPA